METLLAPSETLCEDFSRLPLWKVPQHPHWTAGACLTTTIIIIKKRCYHQSFPSPPTPAFLLVLICISHARGSSESPALLASSYPLRPQLLYKLPAASPPFRPSVLLPLFHPASALRPPLRISLAKSHFGILPFLFLNSL